MLRSSVAAPISKVSLFNFFIKENSLPNFITAPLTPLSLNNVFEPAPNIKVLSFFSLTSLKIQLIGLHF